MKASALVLTSAVLAALPARALDDAHWVALYERLRPSTVIVVANGGLCSGSLVESDLVLTARHCVAALPEVQVRTEDDASSARLGRVVALDAEHDLALVRLDAPLGRPVLALRPEHEPVRPGDAVLTIGHPQAVRFLDVEPQLTFAMLVGHVAKVSADALVTNLGATNGNSGGPVVDAQGRLLSVTSEKVGFFGTIVRGPTPAQVRALVEAARRDRPAPLGWWSSTSRFAVQLHGMLAGRGESWVSASVVGLEFDLKSRLSLSVQGTLDDESGGLLLGLGWRHGLRTASMVPLHVHPRLGLASEDVAGFGRAGGLFATLRLEAGGAHVEAGGLRIGGRWATLLLVGADLAQF